MEKGNRRKTFLVGGEVIVSVAVVIVVVVMVFGNVGERVFAGFEVRFGAVVRCR